MLYCILSKAYKFLLDRSILNHGPMILLLITGICIGYKGASLKFTKDIDELKAQVANTKH
jgi:hypothetical protein